jgi:TetR/AcrR family transcriptional regulator, cholesterol catabolism regulator
MVKRKEKYIEKAMEVFKQDGLRMPLDEIADKMGITKKTLYNHFDSKEALLSECIHSFVSEMKQQLNIMHADEIDAATGMKKGFEAIAGFFYSLSPVFLLDLKKMYPEMANAEHTAGFSFFIENVRKNLKKGIKEDTYRKDIDVNLISQYITYSVFAFFMNKVLISSDFSSKGYFKTMVDYHLRAIVSCKWQEEHVIKS